MKRLKYNEIKSNFNQVQFDYLLSKFGIDEYQLFEEPNGDLRLVTDTVDSIIRVYVMEAGTLAIA
jgi:hypothetical protein